MKRLLLIRNNDTYVNERIQLKKSTVFIAVIAVLFTTVIITFCYQCALIKRNMELISELVAEREVAFKELNVSLKQLGETNEVRVSSEDYISVSLNTANFNDDELEKLLMSLSSISYAPRGWDSDPRIYLSLNGTSVTLNGIKQVIENDSIPFLGIRIGPEICFSKDSVECIYQLWEKDKMDFLSIHGNFDQSEINAIRKRYFSCKEKVRVEKRLWYLLSMEITVGNKTIDLNNPDQNL